MNKRDYVHNKYLKKRHVSRMHKNLIGRTQEENTGEKDG